MSEDELGRLIRVAQPEAWAAMLRRERRAFRAKLCGWIIVALVGATALTRCSSVSGQVVNQREAVLSGLRSEGQADLRRIALGHPTRYVREQAAKVYLDRWPGDPELQAVLEGR